MAKSAKIRLLLVDDHEVVRVGLKTLLSKDPNVLVVGSVGTAAQAVAEAARRRPDLVLMDVRLPDGNGINVCRDIRKMHPETKVLFLSSYADDGAIVATVTAGANGFLLKEIDAEGLVRSIKSAMAGQSILHPVATQRMQMRLSTAAEAHHVELLSYQEQRVLELVAKGLTNKEIAAALALSPKTIKNYVSNLYEKLHVTRRSEAAALYVRHSTE